MTHAPHRSDHTPDEPLPLTKSPTLMGRLRQAFGRAAPGGASSTPSPTQGRSSGISAPGVAETARRQGAPDREVGTEGGRDPDELHAVQQQILRPAPPAEPAVGKRAVQSVQPAIRRFTGTKRTVRVGPLRFTGDEHNALQEAAAENGYKGESGFAADIDLSSLDGANGFKLVAPVDAPGVPTASGAGDVNGDGYDDLVIGTSAS